MTTFDYRVHDYEQIPERSWRRKQKGKKKILFLTFDYRVHDYEQILEESWRGKWERKQENPFLEQVLLNLARWAVNCFHRAPPPFSLKTPPLVSDPSEGVKQIAHVL